MPEFEVVADPVARLKAWSSELLESLRADASLPEQRVRFGERHGSWFLSLQWSEGSLDRGAAIALTNAEALGDAVAESVFISVQSSASSDERFVVESIYDRRRSVRRLEPSQLEGWLFAAIARSRQYTPTSLTSSYETGI